MRPWGPTQSRTYNQLWHETQEALGSLLDKEAQEVQSEGRARAPVLQALATFYIKYVQVFRTMEAVYDQMLHPQKRRLVRLLLDAVMGRILELKQDLVELELSEFHYFDDILQDLKLAPQQLEIPIPKYFMKEKQEAIKGRESILAHILTQARLEVPTTKFPLKPLPLEEAVKLVQMAERARQGRLRAMFMKHIFMQEVHARQHKLLGERTLDLHGAAIRIQKVWRGFHQCKKTAQARQEEMVFLGMVPSAEFQEASAPLVRAEQVAAMRTELQLQQENDYRVALLSVEEELRKMEARDMREDMQEQLRRWFIECRNLTGMFPDFPKAEDGGSALILSHKTPTQVIEDILVNLEEEEKSKKSKKEKKPKKEKVKKETPEKTKEEEEGWRMSPSVFLSIMEEGNKQYKDKWQRKEEPHSLPQTLDTEMIKEEKRRALEAEVRLQVDELMRQELRNLKLAVNREKEVPVKAARTQDGPKKKGKQEKKGKDKDLTADRTIESLYKEVVEQGLLIQAVKVKLTDFIGEHCFLGTALRQVSVEPMPSLLDVRQLVTLYGILPLGSAAVHEKAPLVKSLLLAGPAGVGKKMLVHAICTETGANLFDLSPGNIAGKYPGKAGLQMMLHVVFKVARQLQPSVVWIGDTEKTFYKRVPNTERTLDPKRLKKQLPRILKLLKPDDRVLIVGTTRRPFDADLQPFCKVYQKIILVPRPDYASRYVLWKEVIQQHKGVVSNALNLSSLAKVTDGFTQGHIVQVVRTVLTERRLRQQDHRPLIAAEFIAALTSVDPVYQEEEDCFKDWYAKTPLGRRRAEALAGTKLDK